MSNLEIFFILLKVFELKHIQPGLPIDNVLVWVINYC